jgi:hypothetical protein
MPIEVGIWRINGGIKKVNFSLIEAEGKLEAILCKDIGVLDAGLMIIGHQIPTSYGTIIDILAIDAQGDLTVIELKRSKTPREVVAQILDYASWVQTLTYEQITTLYADRHQGQRFEQAFSEQFETDPPEGLNENHRLVIVASELDNSTERIINYLSSGFGVPINAVFFRYFRDGENEYLTRSWLIDPNQAEAQASKAASSRSGKEAWNGRDWYVSLGVGESRSWDDCQKYGFVSAGGGHWYINTLQLLPAGARVFVCVPKKGYVGVGIVKETAVRVRDFKVVLDDGMEKPILEMSPKASKMGEFADDPDMSEYLVRVEWLKTVPLEHAVWEKGMFANQNSACKLRNGFTIERLSELFGLEEE